MPLFSILDDMGGDGEELGGDLDLRDGEDIVEIDEAHDVE